MENSEKTEKLNLLASPKGAYKRNNPTGKIYMHELDELERLIEDERATTKQFRISMVGISLFGAPMVSLVKEITDLDRHGILSLLIDKWWLYLPSVVLFIISCAWAVSSYLQSRKDKDRAISKIHTIKFQHGYESQGSTQAG